MKVFRSWHGVAQFNPTACFKNPKKDRLPGRLQVRSGLCRTHFGEGIHWRGGSGVRQAPPARQAAEKHIRQIQNQMMIVGAFCLSASWLKATSFALPPPPLPSLVPLSRFGSKEPLLTSVRWTGGGGSDGSSPMDCSASTSNPGEPARERGSPPPGRCSGPRAARSDRTDAGLGAGSGPLPCGSNPCGSPRGKPAVGFPVEIRCMAIVLTTPMPVGGESPRGNGFGVGSFFGGGGLITNIHQFIVDDSSVVSFRVKPCGLWGQLPV